MVAGAYKYAIVCRTMPFTTCIRHAWRLNVCCQHNKLKITHFYDSRRKERRGGEGGVTGLISSPGGYSTFRKCSSHVPSAYAVAQHKIAVLGTEYVFSVLSSTIWHKCRSRVRNKVESIIQAEEPYKQAYYETAMKTLSKELPKSST